MVAPHVSQFPVEIRFVLIRFHSPLLTESLLISFPPPTKMLQFGGFPIASRLYPKIQEVPFSHLRIQDILASPRSLSQLVTTFIGTRAERSPSWVVASHVCIPHHASNPSVSNSCQFGFRRRPPPRGMVLLSPSPDSNCRGAKQPSDLPLVYE